LTGREGGVCNDRKRASHVTGGTDGDWLEMNVSCVYECKEPLHFVYMNAISHTSCPDVCVRDTTVADNTAQLSMRLHAQHHRHG